MKEVAFSVEGAMDDPNPAKETVRIYWKQFTAGWRRQGPAIPENIKLPVTMVCLLSCLSGQDPHSWPRD
jgi:hypothetical protein